MTITKVKFTLCPARFHVLYTDDNGDDKYAYALAMGVCHSCEKFMLKRIERGMYD